MTRHLLFLCLFLPCLAAAAAPPPDAPSPAEPEGVLDIEFGTPKEKAIQFLIERHHLKMYGAPNEYFGDSYFNLKVTDDFLAVPEYCVKKNCYDLYLMFGKAGRFYSYFLKTKGVTANHFDTKLQSEAAALSEIFKKEFGEPGEKYKPGFFDVRQGYDVMFWRWPNPDFDIFTALNMNDSIYYALAKVTHRKFAEEERGFAAKQISAPIK